MRREQERLEKAEQARRETERILREQRAAIDAKEVCCLCCIVVQGGAGSTKHWRGALRSAGCTVIEPCARVPRRT